MLLVMFGASCQKHITYERAGVLAARWRRRAEISCLEVRVLSEIGVWLLWPTGGVND